MAEGLDILPKVTDVLIHIFFPPTNQMTSKEMQRIKQIPNKQLYCGCCFSEVYLSNITVSRTTPNKNSPDMNKKLCAIREWSLGRLSYLPTSVDSCANRTPSVMIRTPRTERNQVPYV